MNFFINQDNYDQDNYDQWYQDNYDGLLYIYNSYKFYRTALSRDIAWEEFLEFMYSHS